VITITTSGAGSITAGNNEGAISNVMEANGGAAGSGGAGGSGAGAGATQGAGGNGGNGGNSGNGGKVTLKAGTGGILKSGTTTATTISATSGMFSANNGGAKGSGTGTPKAGTNGVAGKSGVVTQTMPTQLTVAP
jgi:hypothetical protein